MFPVPHCGWRKLPGPDSYTIFYTLTGLLGPGADGHWEGTRTAEAISAHREGWEGSQGSQGACPDAPYKTRPQLLKEDGDLVPGLLPPLASA